MRIFRARLAAVLLPVVAIGIMLGAAASPASAAPGDARASWSNFASVGIGMVDPHSSASRYDYIMSGGTQGMASGFYVGPGYCVDVYHRLDTRFDFRNTVGYGQHFAGDNGVYRLVAYRC